MVMVFGGGGFESPYIDFAVGSWWGVKT
jgi:hypothetical protein